MEGGTRMSRDAVMSDASSDRIWLLEPVVFHDQIVCDEVMVTGPLDMRPGGVFTVRYPHKIGTVQGAVFLQSGIDGIHFVDAVIGEHQFASERMLFELIRDDEFGFVLLAVIFEPFEHRVHNGAVLECEYPVIEQRFACFAEIIRVTEVCQFLDTCVCIS